MNDERFVELRLYVIDSIAKKYNSPLLDDIVKKAGISLFLKHLRYRKTNVYIKDMIHKLVDIRENDKEIPYQQYFYNLIHSLRYVPNCVVCGKPCRFISISKGYYDTCGIKCANNKPEKHEKTRNTNLVKYGVKNVFMNENIKAKSKKTIQAKYGVDNVSRLRYIREKAENTMVERYGAKYSHQSPELIERMKQKLFEKHGVYNISESKKYNDIKVEKSRRRFFDGLLNSNRLKGRVTPNFKSDDYKGIKHKYSWTCVECGYVFKSDINNAKIPRCFICHPRENNFSSAGENDLYDYVKSIYNLSIIHGDRSLIYPLELDVYIPDAKLAIEYNGLYWHSELGGEKDRMYHYNKYKLCKEKGVHLISVFEDEWINKQDILKSLISNKLGVSPIKLNARDCVVKSISKQICSNFLDSNHIQGTINGKIRLGLFHVGKLVACIVVGHPRFSSKNNQYEILRFCSKKNTVVRGALGKLFKSFTRSCKPTSVITYSDLRYGEGDSYKQLGFELDHTSSPSYSYMPKGYASRENRMAYQKSKLQSRLPIFDSTLTEWGNMQMNGYDRIWDCGNKVYTLHS